MVWTVLDSYLDRDVRLSSVRCLDEVVVEESLSGSVVMIVITERQVDRAELKRFAERLVGGAPLSICFFGAGSDVALDATLSVQGSLPEGEGVLHAMTKLCHGGSLEEAVEDFLSATWPAEERFDEWRSYSVVVVGDQKDRDAAESALREVLESGSAG